MAAQDSGSGRIAEFARRIRAGEPIDATVMPHCDVHLRGMKWGDDNLDMEFGLCAEHHGFQLEWALVARWVYELEVNLDYKHIGGGGMPMTSNTVVEQDAENAWFVLFDFASVGEVRFLCTALEIRECVAKDRATKDA